MGGGSVANAVHAPHDGVERGVVADGVVGAVEVVVDGARKTDNREVEIAGKLACSCERAIATNHHQCVDTVALNHLVGTLASFDGGKFLASCGFENGATLLNDIRHILGFEFHYIIVDKSFISTVNAFHFKSAENCRAGHGANGGVHAWSIASGSENTDSFDLCHNEYKLKCLYLKIFFWSHKFSNNYPKNGGFGSQNGTFFVNFYKRCTQILVVARKMVLRV